MRSVVTRVMLASVACGLAAAEAGRQSRLVVARTKVIPRGARRRPILIRRFMELRCVDVRACRGRIPRAVPGSAADLLTTTVDSVLSKGGGGLLSFGFLFAIWSASSGLLAVMEQLNVVFEVKEERSFLRARAVSLLLTICCSGLSPARILAICAPSLQLQLDADCRPRPR